MNMIHSSTQSDQRHERLIQSLLFYITQYKTLYSCPRFPCVSHEHHMIHSSTQSDQRHERLIQSLLFYITQYKTLYSCPRFPCVSHEHDPQQHTVRSETRAADSITSRKSFDTRLLTYKERVHFHCFTSFFSFMLLFSAAISQSTNIFRVSFELCWWEGHRSKLNVFLSVQWLIIIILLSSAITSSVTSLTHCCCSFHLNIDSWRGLNRLWK